jgi:hypothetical protein
MRPIFRSRLFAAFFIALLERISMTITEFLRAEDGVATVDWVVLLAALTGAWWCG